jgi:hypothetical protein
MNPYVRLPVFTYEDPNGNEERLVIKMNGEVIADVNHDDHGWDGIHAVREAVGKIEFKLKKAAKEQ